VQSFKDNAGQLSVTSVMSSSVTASGTVTGPVKTSQVVAAARVWPQTDP